MVTYMIEGDSRNLFRCLGSAKRYICFHFNQEDKLKLLSGKSILRIDDGNIITKTPIVVTNDGYSFGKTRRI